MSEEQEKIYEDLELAYSELAERLKIDKYKLDDEVVQQPQTYEEVCNVVSLLYGQKETYEYKLSFRKSELWTKVSQRLQALDIRPTEKLVGSEVEVDPDIKTLSEMYVKYDTLHKKWDNLKRCYEQRMEAIQGEIRLLSCGYSAYSRKFD
jgi:hypothetical protein